MANLTLSEFISKVSNQLSEHTCIVAKERRGYSVVLKKNLRHWTANGWVVVHEGGPVSEPRGAKKVQPEPEPEFSDAAEHGEPEAEGSTGGQDAGQEWSKEEANARGVTKRSSRSSRRKK